MVRQAQQLLGDTYGYMADLLRSRPTPGDERDKNLWVCLANMKDPHTGRFIIECVQNLAAHKYSLFCVGINYRSKMIMLIFGVMQQSEAKNARGGDWASLQRHFLFAFKGQHLHSHHKLRPISLYLGLMLRLLRHVGLSWHSASLSALQIIWQSRAWKGPPTHTPKSHSKMGPLGASVAPLFQNANYQQNWKCSIIYTGMWLSVWQETALPVCFYVVSFMRTMFSDTADVSNPAANANVKLQRLGTLYHYKRATALTVQGSYFLGSSSYQRSGRSWWQGLTHQVTQLLGENCIVHKCVDE